MSLIATLKAHWPEYLMEAWGLGTFMVSACLFTILLEHPDSTVHQMISNPLLRRFLTGTAMGLTLICIVHSPWGKRSGAHLNPTFSWTFYRLGKVQFWDAAFYSLAQFTGGIAGVAVTASFFQKSLSHPAVHYAATVPGPGGPAIAFLAEAGISLLMMTAVLNVSNHPKLNRYTAFCAAILVAIYITLEAPLSGMSMNPARTFGSAAHAAEWRSLWIYFVAPPIGMFVAAEAYVLRKGAQRVYCAKFHHQNNKRCIFNCNFAELASREERKVSAIL
jgi:aquaporin Z